MNLGIKTFYALKTFEVKSFFGLRKKQVTQVVAETRASSWLWATVHFAGVDYDDIVSSV